MYHWRDGWYFNRETDGSVTVLKREQVAHDRLALRLPVARIPASEWASIVAAVSKSGDTGEQFRRAEELHAS